MKRADGVFNFWLVRLEREMKKRGVRKYYPKRLAQHCWKDYFNDCYSPKDALLSDLSYIED